MKYHEAEKEAAAKPHNTVRPKSKCIRKDMNRPETRGARVWPRSNLETLQLSDLLITLLLLYCGPGAWAGRTDWVLTRYPP